MIKSDNPNLSIIKDSNNDMLDYFNAAYIKKLELMQDLKTELFELNIKIEEIEKTRNLYTFRNDNRRSLFSPLNYEESPISEKSKQLDDQLAGLRDAKLSLEQRIREIEDDLNHLSERIDNLNKASKCISELITEDSSILNSEEAMERDGFEIIEEADNEDKINHGYNILMLEEFNNSVIANILDKTIKQHIISSNNKLEVLKWLVNSDIARAKITLDELLNSNSQIISSIDAVIDELNYNIDSDEPIWMSINTLINRYKNAHPECLIESDVDCTDHDIDIHPIITIYIVTILDEIFKNIFMHSNANKVTAKIYISNRIIDVYVNDNGVGIDSEYMKKSKWYSGLHKVQEILYLLDGRIKIEGDIISGTNVRFSLPVIRKDIQ